ncbi:MAG: diaminopimelate epimerase [Bacteroidales bacterium]
MPGIIPFAKFESTGNDFIMVDNRSGTLNLATEEISRWCHRRYGTGADGLILLEHHPREDFWMRYFNADGREASFCGNGGRAICGFAAMLGMPGNTHRFEAFDGIHQGEILGASEKTWDVSLSMHDVTSGGGKLIDTGSPHLIIEADDPDDLDVNLEGSKFRYAPEYAPDGCNVNFVRMVNGVISIRTYERGVESETLSCGTGTTAAAIYHHLHQPDGAYTTPVHARGGDLTVSFVKQGVHFTDIHLIGPTRCVFLGEYYL